jgi:hypothetical protein
VAAGDAGLSGSADAGAPDSDRAPPMIAATMANIFKARIVFPSPVEFR